MTSGNARIRLQTRSKRDCSCDVKGVGREPQSKCDQSQLIRCNEKIFEQGRGRCLVTRTGLRPSISRPRRVEQNVSDRPLLRLLICGSVDERQKAR